MRHAIIGTAGHVDHGKTCLVKALTGMDTDRLKEEKERGITIELGFAYLDFPDGCRAGIVDVPGHEKFVKNMAAGAGGMDVAMLIVAADEGVMPQTEEHLDILSLLGIQKGVIVITKVDLASPELLELVRSDIRELTKGTFLENGPILPVSAVGGQGLKELKVVLQELCAALPEKKEKSMFRLPIDRVFTLKGFGTIVTGTVAEGCLKKEEALCLYPGNLPVRVRSIQVHSSEQETVGAGQRAAVNLAGCKKEEIHKGDVLAQKGSLFPTKLLDVKLEVLQHTKRSIRSGNRVHIYHGTKELLGKVVLMEQEKLRAGERGYAKLRLEQETVAKKGDLFVVRFYSPVETIGGGVVLDANPQKHRRNDKRVLDSFAVKEYGTPEELLELSVKEHFGKFYTLQELSLRSGLDENGLRQNAIKLHKAGKLTKITENIYIHREELLFYQKKTEGFLEEFHKSHPLEPGMGREEIRSRLGIGNTAFADSILLILISENVLKEEQGIISRAQFEIAQKKGEKRLLEETARYYQKAGYAPLTTRLYIAEHKNQKQIQAALASLWKQNIVIRLDGQYCLHRDYYERAKTVFCEMAKERPAVVLGEFRDSLGCSRKIAIALLEHFDKSGFTRKTEGGRILRLEAGKEGERDAE